MQPQQTLEGCFREAASSSRSWFLRKTGDPELADELTAQAFLRLCIYYADKPGLEVDTNLLHVINYGLLHNHFRAASSSLLDRHERLEKADGIPTFAGYEEHELAEELTDAIRSLPDEERTELTLWLLRGLTVREIADLTDVHYSIVSRRVSRALKRIERILS